jgi:hypothetical protein
VSTLQFSAPRHPLTVCALHHAAWLASMILPVNDEAITLRFNIEAAIDTRDLATVEAALTVPMLEYQPRRNRGVVLATWKGWCNQWLAMNQALIWAEVEQAEQERIAA